MMRVFKAKYFYTTTFTHAKLGSDPSFIWRSMGEAANELREGFRWKVWDCKNIRVWNDPWLPDNINPYIVTP